jgi:membrane-bound metal-dependent hydrolase YbcI (DUF457 family)
VDPVSHIVIGRAAVAAIDQDGLSRFGPGAGAAAILGALVPDIDAALVPTGWDIYLRYHQVGTHSIVGACALGCGVGILLRALVRGSRLSGLAMAASVAAMSHLLLDLLSGATIGLAWPFVRARLGLPLAAMAEPWLVGVLVGGALWMWAGRRRLRRAAITVLVAAGLFFAAKATLYASAVRSIAGDSRIAATAPRVLEARWGSWPEWNVFVRDPDALRVWRVRATNGVVIPLRVQPIEVNPPLVNASRTLDTVRNFLSVHDFGFALEFPEPSGRLEVLWSDVRYCREGRPASARVDCALWFGGVFERDGRALRQETYVGDWIQQRPVSR